MGPMAGLGQRPLLPRASSRQRIGGIDTVLCCMYGAYLTCTPTGKRTTSESVEDIHGNTQIDVKGACVKRLQEGRYMSMQLVIVVGAGGEGAEHPQLWPKFNISSMALQRNK